MRLPVFKSNCIAQNIFASNLLTLRRSDQIDQRKFEKYDSMSTTQETAVKTKII